MLEPVMRIDDFNLLSRDKFFIQVRLELEEEKRIEIVIFYIDEKGISKKVKDKSEIIIKVKDVLLLHKWVEIIDAIRKLEDDTVSEIIEGIKTCKYNVSEIDHPNEYTMSESSWYKHNFIFLSPFYSYDGALLRLSYLVGELINAKAITEEDIVLDQILKDYPVKF